MIFSARIHRLAGTLEQVAALLEGSPVAKAWAAKAPVEPGPDGPTYTAILDAALDATGLRETWEAGTLEGRAVLDLLHAVRLEGRRHLRAMAEALLEDVAPDGEKALMGGVRAKVGAFFGRAKRYVRELFAAGVLAIAGPDPAVLDAPVVRDALEKQVAVQMEYMDKFQDRVVSEAKPLGPMVVSNAEQFGAAVYGAAIEVQRQEIVAAAKAKEEKRNLEACQHCTDCPEISAKGWQPIGTLPPIGFKDHKGTPTACRIHCRCWFSYR